VGTFTVLYRRPGDQEFRRPGVQEISLLKKEYLLFSWPPELL